MTCLQQAESETDKFSSTAFACLWQALFQSPCQLPADSLGDSGVAMLLLPEIAIAHGAAQVLRL